MIGLIGPADSTRLCLSVALEEGLADQVMVRAYESADDAPGLAHELDQVCQVLLFTGRVPYALGRRSGGLSASLRFVPHAGADLYRALIQLLRRSHGEMPRMSLDTIEAAIVREAFEDLGLEPPQHIMPLGLAGSEELIRPVAEITGFHLERARAGDVDVCVTCLESVHRELIAAGVTAWRISHTRAAFREALRQAHLEARLNISETTQPAVILISVPDQEPTLAADPASYEAQSWRLHVRESVLDVAERLQGRLSERDDGTFMVFTSRGIAESAISRWMAGHGGPLQLHRSAIQARLGIGFGSTASAAEERARQALVMGERDGDLHVAFPNGEVLRAGRDRSPTTYRLRETHDATLRVAEHLGLGPLSLARLTRALRQVDASSVTAAELARAYGIEARSARRLMTSLQRAGIAIPLGRLGGARAGRPQTIYRIDVGRLIPSEAEDA